MAMAVVSRTVECNELVVSSNNLSVLRQWRKKRRKRMNEPLGPKAYGGGRGRLTEFSLILTKVVVCNKRKQVII